MSNENEMMGSNGMNNLTDPALHPFGVIPDGSMPDASSSLTDEQAEQLSRSNSLKRLSTGGGRDGRSMTGPGPGGSSRAGFDQSYAGGIASTMPPGMNPSLAFSMPNGQNGHSYSQNYDFAGNGNTMQPQSVADLQNLSNGRIATVPVFTGSTAGDPQMWSQMFQPTTQDGFMSPYNPNMSNSQAQIKQETNPNGLFPGGYPSNGSNSQGSLKQEATGNGLFPGGYPSNSSNPQAPMKQETNANTNGLFPGQYPSNGSNSQGSIKQEANTNGLFPGVYPSNGLNPSSDLPNWNFQDDPLEQISNRLVYFCFPPNSPMSSRSSEMRKFLSADNIKEFLEQFCSFQSHFPVIHMPTFRISEAYNGLLLGMICIGAVYSERMTPSQVREMMELAKVAIGRNSEVYAIILQENNGNSYGNERIGSTNSEIEQITAIFMMQVLFTWHGTPVQREKARREFPLVVAFARRAGLTQPMTTTPLSVLHQHNVSVEHFNAASFDWSAWVEQEKRSRLLYTIFLFDVAMTLYFNIEPLFNSYEIQIPLPADDAAWDSRTSAECAQALSLHGPVAARDRNPEGTRRSKQPEMDTALKALMHNVYDLQPGTTNLFSKFILVHALHVQLWLAQRQLSNESAQLNSQALAFPSSGASTPMSQNDWVIRNVDPAGSSVSSNNTSGRVTPVEADMQHFLQRINTALDKWKKAWDKDMAAQFPPQSKNPRRLGFCRDGTPFYYLGKFLMQSGSDSRVAPDQRFTQIMNLIKSIRHHVVTDSTNRGEQLGSVSDIDQDYGVTNLTLDMAQLFKPINKQLDSSVAGVHTNIGGGMIETIGRSTL
jgi:hypothetical protein